MTLRSLKNLLLCQRHLLSYHRFDIIPISLGLLGQGTCLYLAKYNTLYHPTLISSFASVSTTASPEISIESCVSFPAPQPYLLRNFCTICLKSVSPVFGGIAAVDSRAMFSSSRICALMGSMLSAYWLPYTIVHDTMKIGHTSWYFRIALSKSPSKWSTIPRNPRATGWYGSNSSTFW